MDLHLDIERAPGRSLRARVEHSLREAIRDGRLAADTRLPSTRALCSQLGVSRGVVAEAYAQLAAEGYLHTRRGAGTTVAPAVSRKPGPARTRGEQPRLLHDMNPFRPALDGFPRLAWSGALGRVLRTVADERLGYPDPLGAPELRAALASYLGRVRGVRADPEQVVVTGGLRHGMDLLWPILASAGVRRLAVERPGWGGMSETATAAGLRLVPVEVDAQGLDVERLETIDADAVALAPAHQYPSGAVLSASRRTRLVEWARRGGRVIVEDDYDAEYRYDRQPIGSLQGLAPEHVVYGGSASKTLAPVLRLGWLVLPSRLLADVAASYRRRGGTPSPLLQLALGDLIERGEVDRHLRRQRRRYKRRREIPLTQLSRTLPELTVRGAAAGLYVVLGLPRGVDPRTILARARSQGIVLEALKASGDGAGAALVIGYANLPETAIAPAVAALAEAIGRADAGNRAR